VTTNTYAGHTYGNGETPAAILANLEGSQGVNRTETAQLRLDAAASWNRAAADVKARTGLEVWVRGWNRTYMEQVTFYLERHTPAAAGDRVCCRWNGRGYRFTGTAHAAPPGTSNHGWGLAVDVVDFGGVGQWNHPRRVAAFPILAEHGWTDTEGRSAIQEPWHLVYDPARDRHANQAAQKTTPPAPAPAPDPEGDPVQIIRRASDGAAFIVTAAGAARIVNTTDLTAYKNAGAREVNLTDAGYAEAQTRLLH